MKLQLSVCVSDAVNSLHGEAMIGTRDKNVCHQLLLAGASSSVTVCGSLRGLMSTCTVCYHKEVSIHDQNSFLIEQLNLRFLRQRKVWKVQKVQRVIVLVLL